MHKTKGSIKISTDRHKIVKSVYNKNIDVSHDRLLISEVYQACTDKRRCKRSVTLREVHSKDFINKNQVKGDLQGFIVNGTRLATCSFSQVVYLCVFSQSSTNL